MTRATPSIGPVLESCLYASNLEECAGFYERVLGLEAIARVPDRHVFFRAGTGVFLLFHPTATSRPGGEVPAHGATGPGHLAFAVPATEIVAWRARLAQLEVEIETEIDWPSGGASIYLRDPAGNSVELASPGIWSIPEALVFAASDPD
jgi:catechol 2,3-dioxygenase-like lactoylglutathione lyase family enzyme